MTLHHIEDLIEMFNQCFKWTHQTLLVKGKEEPIYIPAQDDNAFHCIYFAHGFFSSALHECAHWFIAGKKRRLEIDYGYWYKPDGRTAEEQALFQQVEVKPQALEWILSQAAQYPFQFSLDNLNGELADTLLFKQNVLKQVEQYCQNGLPSRANIFRNALCQFYRTPIVLCIEDFTQKKI